MESFRTEQPSRKVNRNAFKVPLVGPLSYFRVDVVKGSRAIFLALFMATVRIL
jgi:hypothetical protein